MRASAWASVTCLPLAGLIFSWVDGTTAESPAPICLTRNWRDVEAKFIQWPACVETRWDSNVATRAVDPISFTVSEASTPPTTTATPTSPTPSDDRPDADADTDSLLDNANFLSFEDWKKQNLAKVGQSAENVGGSRRAGAAGKEDRHRPTGINNALDSLGEDVEIELDFGGFGADTADTAKPTAWGARVPVETKGDGGDARVREEGGGPAGDESPAQGVARRGKDAGTTCKERFNYASFDCAATVLKTNPECKGSSSVLIENKDSYMLNECRANNKFLILELCDDILVDTVVLANYEFFSSIFRTFRVSVSDRYPAKPDQWRELGVYEARNTREVQAFAVSNPLIWARYLRIEFLTHYGNEFYCPVSLIRVHGTTMLEEYKHDGEAGRGDDEVSEPSGVEVNPSAGQLDEKDSQPPATAPSAVSDSVEGSTVGSQTEKTCPHPGVEVEARLWGGALVPLGMCSVHDKEVHTSAGDTTAQADAGVVESTSHMKDPPAVADAPPKAPADEQKVTVPAGGHADSSASAASTTTVAESATQNTTVEADSKPSILKEEQAAPPEATRATGTQPPSPNPTTQESFFKSVNKRLQMLESNSTLSLLYIEEQSRILRDAFNKVEKRQLAKTSTFLEGLNVTVLNELKQFREQYDQVWKSVALEFEHQRIQYHQEIYSISAQLGVLADELVFQKRVSVIQSIMVLFCFALVLFSRGTVSSYIDFPSVQNMVARSYSLRSSSPPFGSPSVSPSSTRPASSYRGGTTTGAGHRRNISEDSQDAALSPTIAYSPPTPTSDDASSPVEAEKDESALSMPEMTPSHLRSRSSPPVMDGGRDADERCSEESEESEAEGDAGVELR
ncbi:UNC-like C-terminal-domain-containing protein [Aspergillus floccosus]